MVASQAVQAFRQDAMAGGRIYTAQQREDLLKPYLPSPPPFTLSKARKQRPIRDFLSLQFHLLIYHVIHAVFSVYLRVRQTYHIVLDRVLAILYYHHRAPELIKQDVRGLSRLPEHLSVILELKGVERGTAGLEGLMDDLAEISAWCACVGIPMLSVYEKTGRLIMSVEKQKYNSVLSGILKSYVPTTHRIVSRKMHAYFGQRVPSLQIRAPHMPSFLNGDASEKNDATLTPAGKAQVMFNVQAKICQDIFQFCFFPWKMAALPLSTSREL